MIRTLIVDDEPLARDVIRQVLERESDVEVVGEAHDGKAAVKRIEELKPDLVFLDVKMPGYDGIDVVRRIADKHLPLVVFVTAHDQHAVEAFALNAVDYVLKPVTPRRLQDALRRVRLDLGNEEELARRHGAVVNVLSRRDKEPSAGAEYVRRFAARDREGYAVVKATEVSWIESAGNYVQLHADNRTFLLRATMADLEKRLDPLVFVRVHRTAIINLDRVKAVSGHGEYSVILDDGTALPVSRKWRDRVFSYLYRGQHD